MATLARVEIFCFRYPLAQPMNTVFGRIVARPALIVRLEDDEGATGWGEIWCNFPPPGAEYRANLAAAVAPRALAGLKPEDSSGAFWSIRPRIHNLALQAGEAGPADQVAAGFDIALHDLAARRSGIALASFLGGAPRALQPYASGIDCRLASSMIGAAREKGYRAFKMRIGFSRETAIDAMGEAQSVMDETDTLMADVNQNWDVDTAVSMLRDLAEAPLSWIEEPLPVDRPEDEWHAVASASPFPVAGGENMRSQAQFDAAITSGIFGVIQPDVCKWGGLSATVTIARNILKGGKRYCPHYLGGGVGLMVSAHLLAAVGGDGLLEVDVNDNALREALCGPLLPLEDGLAVVPDAPGLGYTPDIEGLRDYRVVHHDIRIDDADV